MGRPGSLPGWIGAALVGLQFLLLAVLGALALRGLRAGPVPPDAPLAAAVAVALGLWALSANRPGNFNIRPLPRAGARLVRHGPYRWIRHPMYSALMLAGVSAARLSGETAAGIALAALVLVLMCKAEIEERALMRLHPDYRAYRRGTRRFVPGLF